MILSMLADIIRVGRSGVSVRPFYYINGYIIGVKEDGGVWVVVRLDGCQIRPFVDGCGHSSFQDLPAFEAEDEMGLTTIRLKGYHANHQTMRCQYQGFIIGFDRPFEGAVAQEIWCDDLGLLDPDIQAKVGQTNCVDEDSPDDPDCQICDAIVPGVLFFPPDIDEKRAQIIKLILEHQVKGDDMAKSLKSWGLNPHGLKIRDNAYCGYVFSVDGIELTPSQFIESDWIESSTMVEES